MKQGQLQFIGALSLDDNLSAARNQAGFGIDLHRQSDLQDSFSELKNHMNLRFLEIMKQLKKGDLSLGLKSILSYFQH